MRLIDLTTTDGLPIDMFQFEPTAMESWQARIPYMKQVMAVTYQGCKPGPLTLVPRADGRCWVVVPVYYGDAHVADVLPFAPGADYFMFEPADYENTSDWINE